MSGEKSVDYMTPKRDESPSEGEENPPEGEEIPTGWDVKYVVQKDGALKVSYYCPDTEQRFYTYRSLIRYVDYAKKRRFGPYGPMCKPDQIRAPIVRVPVLSPSPSPIPSPRKTTAALSIPGWPRQSSSDSDSDDDSESSSTGESSDVEEDGESVPKKDAAVFPELGTDAAGKRYKVAQKKPVEELGYKDTWQWSKTFRRGG